MYAVIETGGKQYRVAPGDVIDVERLPDAEGPIVFDRVLMVGGDEVRVGDPVVAGAAVKAAKVGDVRGPKILVLKRKRRKRYRRRVGYRQDLQRVRIEEISL